jgi:NADH-quinone oxidoreductase subunit N
MSPLADLLYSLPYLHAELLLAGFALSAVVVGAWGGEKSFALLNTLGVLALLGAGVLAMIGPLSHGPVLQGALAVDYFGKFAKVLVAWSAAATLYLGADHFGRTGDKKFEFPILVVLAVLGMFVMVSAQDLITLYVGVELQSLAAYVLAAWRRDDAKSSEAGLKYFVLGAISSGLLLYGSSFIYGFTGSVRFAEIAIAIEHGSNVGIIFGLVLTICALGFKMSAAPFHMWAPDVYEGAPTPITAFFAAAPKIAAVVLLARLLAEPFANITDQWRQVIVALAAISMLVGSFGALLQSNLKRLMAYSSIANMGFALMGLAAGGEQGPMSALIYLALYTPATIGVFALILSMRRGGEAVESVDDLAGVAQRKPWMAALLTILLFSIAGIPPFAGFMGKLIVFQATIQAGLIPLSIVGAIAAVVAAAYYLRILAAVWFKPAVAPLQPASGAVVLTSVIAAALSFPILVLMLGAIETWARLAVQTSF